MAMQVYVKAESKRELNLRLKEGERVRVTEYDIVGRNSYILQDLPRDTICKIFSKTALGTPIAKAYGKWNGSRVL